MSREFSFAPHLLKLRLPGPFKKWGAASMIAAIDGIGPKDELESLLVVQMVSVHNLAMEFMKRTTRDNQTIEGVDASTNRAVRLMRLFMQQVDALNRHRGKGQQQNIVVEHVNVNSGGQAIVGSVQPSGKGRGWMPNSENQPHATRRGWLKNGNPPGDFAKAPRCGEKTRSGTSCQGPAMSNGRCRMHSGKSQGPKTPEGQARSRIANWKHGRFSAAVKAERRLYRSLLRVCSRTLVQKRTPAL